MEMMKSSKKCLESFLMGKRALRRVACVGASIFAFRYRAPAALSLSFGRPWPLMVRIAWKAGLIVWSAFCKREHFSLFSLQVKGTERHVSAPRPSRFAVKEVQRRERDCARNRPRREAHADCLVKACREEARL